MTVPRLVLLAAALIGQTVIAQAQGAFPAPLPGQAAAPAGAPPPMTAAPSAGSSFPQPGAGGFAPSGAGLGGFGAPQQAGPPGAGQQCNTEFSALKEDAQKKAGAISALSKRKGTPVEACKAFQSFTQAETKMISYVETNTQRCRIPPGAADGMKKSHATTMQVQAKICAAAQNAGNQQPAAPSLSEALGSASLPEARTTKKGGSTFDTLSGNVLAR